MVKTQEVCCHSPGLENEEVRVWIRPCDQVFMGIDTCGEMWAVTM